jgi:hypothetical protein
MRSNQNVIETASSALSGTMHRGSLRIGIEYFLPTTEDVVLAVEFPTTNLEGIDIVSLLVEFQVHGPMGASLFPREQRFTTDDWEAAYRQACRITFHQYRTLLIDIGLLQWQFLPLPAAINHFFDTGFSPWKASVLRDCLAQGYYRSPRYAAIRHAIDCLSPAFALRRVLLTSDGPDPRRLQGLQGLRAPRDRDARYLRSPVAFATLHAIWDKKPDLAFVGADGKWYVQKRRLKDAVRDRSKGSLTSPDRMNPDSLDRIAAPAADLLELLTRHEESELVRGLRQAIAAAGDDDLAALEYMEGDEAREVVARRHGTSVKRLRRAEDRVRDGLRRAFGASG